MSPVTLGPSPRTSVGAGGGPVAPAAASPYGLSGSVRSGDRRWVPAVAGPIRTGTVGVNGGLWCGCGPDVAFDGCSQSGFDGEMGVAGFEEHLETESPAEPA